MSHPPTFAEAVEAGKTDMEVSSWKFMGKSEIDTDCTFGLMLGKRNRREHCEGLKQVRVVIDGTPHTFSLDRVNFWTTCPELRDTDVVGSGTPIRDFLGRLGALTWAKGKPWRFKMRIDGRGVFELEFPRASPLTPSAGTPPPLRGGVR